MIDILKEACNRVSAILTDDPTAILNESELQALLQDALLSLCPERVPATLSEGVLRRAHHPDHFVHRVFRELKPFGGRNGKEADLILLANCAQIVEPKENGAPARFRGPFEILIETKVDCTALQPRARSRAADLETDVAKWTSKDREKIRVATVVLTRTPGAYAHLEHTYPVVVPPIDLPDWQYAEAVDPWPAIDTAVHEVADEYARHPLGFIREKDFESRLFCRLRAMKFPRARLELPNGQSVSVDPVRSQWFGPWQSTLGRTRRHDIVVLQPDGLRLLAELELKTSHSDSHNWFRKRDVERELEAMQMLVDAGQLSRARFILFRYGKPIWEADAHALFERFPRVEFSYICA